ncbi:hypothetical protein OAM69_06120 [bacterium]|nr:hypothetical protein [bacterium]
MRKLHLENEEAVMVGFNRRYAPLVRILSGLLAQVVKLNYFNVMINAGAIPLNSWGQSRQLGGERIIGETCHWNILCDT